MIQEQYIKDFNNLTINISHVSQDLIKLEGDIYKNTIEIISANIALASLGALGVKLENSIVNHEERLDKLEGK